MSRYMISSFGNINKKPLVGFGVVGTNTLTNFSLIFFAILIFPKSFDRGFFLFIEVILPFLSNISSFAKSFYLTVSVLLLLA